ncbi:ABC transporter ATP-binding protein [Streptomyces hainanensis]|uniref:ABC transporter ATP-binding protein n=1 Tax=Streptomyces hainanensis TaxID=402648 RepID=UPI001FB5E102|nr:ABC transporter ATP-binding protein [Streptomyces hainanensis]
MLALAVGLVPVIAAWLTKCLLDGLVNGASRRDLLVLAAGLAAIGLLGRLAPHASRYCKAEMNRRVGLLAQRRLFDAVNAYTGLRRFEDPRFLDELRLARQGGGSNPGQAVDGILGILRSATTVGGFLVALWLLSPWAGAFIVMTSAPALVAEIGLSRRRARTIWRVGPAERRELFYGSLLSSVQAAKEVRLFGIGDFLRDRMIAERSTVNVASRAVDWRELWVQTALGALAALATAGGLLWAVGAAATGMLTVGDVTVFAAAVAAVQSSLATIAADVARTHHALVLLRHYVAVVDAGPDLPRSASPRPTAALRRGIELRDVWFRYAPDHPWTLRGVDLFIPHGTSLAVVGRNGAGKSTLVKLLCRFYAPQRGRILWDGVDIADMCPEELRHRIGAVFQDFMSYDLTVTENIALGDLSALGDPERVRAAALRAGVHDTVCGLPRGYDTLLSRSFFLESDKKDPETGIVLSGGQAQRLALARAFLRDGRDLLILDEPSAGLDAEAEHEIHTAIRTHRVGRTSVLISHRLGAVREADLIVVLSEGRVREQGTHDGLMAAGGEYRRLFSLQAAGYRGHRSDEQPVPGGTS